MTKQEAAWEWFQRMVGTTEDEEVRKDLDAHRGWILTSFEQGHDQGNKTLQYMTDALTAIRARINGEYDNKALVAYGPLTTNTHEDILWIINEACDK
jgi:hypothetical protein